MSLRSPQVLLSLCWFYKPEELRECIVEKTVTNPRKPGKHGMTSEQLEVNRKARDLLKDNIWDSFGAGEWILTTHHFTETVDAVAGKFVYYTATPHACTEASVTKLHSLT